jgi:hypothetical protein
MTTIDRSQLQAAATIQDLPGLPAGVKFDPTDQELLEHLEGKARPDARKLHPLIDEFIPTIEGENGICYTHPERLPGKRSVAHRSCMHLHVLVLHCSYSCLRTNLLLPHYISHHNSQKVLANGRRPPLT